MDNFNFEIPKYKVFIKTDEKNRVIAINSSIFISDTTDWIEIDEGIGNKFAHAQSQYLDKSLIDDNGAYNYIYDGELREATEEEKEEVVPDEEPTLEERITAVEQAQLEQDELLATLLFGDE